MPATQPPHGSESAEPDVTGALSATATPPTSAPVESSPPTEASADPPVMGCRLPAPKKSDDACKTDADCGVSEPCHAHACVARGKAHPPDKSTVCTRMMDCLSADANPCGCLDGVCALVPGR